MPDKFTLTIELGDDAMQTASDVADSLESIAEKLRDGDFKPNGEEASIIDENGNTVGSWAAR